METCVPLLRKKREFGTVILLDLQLLSDELNAHLPPEVVTCQLLIVRCYFEEVLPNQLFTQEPMLKAFPLIKPHPFFFEKGSFFLEKVHALGRTERIVYLILAYHSPPEEILNFLSKYRNVWFRRFNAAEIEFLKGLDWDSCPFEPKDVCSNLFSATQIDKIDVVLPYFLNEGREQYALSLKEKTTDFLTEWKLSFDYVVSRDLPIKPLFFFLQASTPLSNHFSEVVELLKNFRGNQNHCWVASLVEKSQSHYAGLARSNKDFFRQSFSTIVKFLRQDLTPESLSISVELSDCFLQKFHTAFLGEERLITTQILAACDRDDGSCFEKIERETILRKIREGPIDDMIELYYKGFLRKRLKDRNKPFATQFFTFLWENLYLKFYSEVTSVRKWVWLSRELHSALVSQEICNLFVDAETFGLDRKRLPSDVGKVISSLATFDIPSDFVDFLKETDYQKRLAVLSGEDVELLYQKAEEKRTAEKKKWENLLSAVKVMTQCKGFRKAANRLHLKYSSAFCDLEKKVISKWDPPVCDTEFQAACDRMSRAQNSIFYLHVWNSPFMQSWSICLDGDDKKIFENWVLYVEAFMKQLMKVVSEFTVGTMDVSLIEKEFFKESVNRIKKQHTQVRRAGQQEAFVRNQLQTCIDETRKNVSRRVADELALLSSLFPLQFKVPTVVEAINNCIDALCSVTDYVAFKKIIVFFGLPEIPSLNSFCALMSLKDSRLLGDVVREFSKVKSDLQDFETVIPSYPALFNHVMLENDLLAILREFRDVRELNYKINHLQGEDIEDSTHDLLSALRLVGEATMEHPEYQRIIRGEKVTISSLISFLITGSSVVGLSILKDKVRSKSGDCVAGALQSVSDERQTIAIVMSLLKNGGVFVIEIKDGATVVSAIIPSDDSGEKKTEMTAEELKVLPSQLLFTSGVIPPEAEISLDFDAELPENISLPEDRLRYVLRFNWLFDTTLTLSQILRDLCVSGHPRFQQVKMEIQCAEKTSNLHGMVKELEQELANWRKSLDFHRKKNPILSFLSRSQLVSCMMALETQKTDLLSSIFQSIGCDPLRMTLELAEKMNKGSFDEEMFSCLADGICEFLDIVLLEKRACEEPIFRVSHPLKEIDSLFKYVCIAGTPIEEVVCGAHIARHNKLPSSIELLFCTERTSEIDIADFIDRWNMYSQVRRGKLEDTVPNISFWLISVEKLNYEIQRHCVDKLRCLPQAPQRRDKNHPSLFLVSTTEDTHIRNVFLHEQVYLSPEMCDKYRKLISRMALDKRKIYVVHSLYCGEGKTESAIKKFGCGDGERGMLYCQLSVDKTPLEFHLKRLAEDCPLQMDQPIVLHFNVSHLVEATEVNLFLFQYLVVGFWRDRFGFAHSRRLQDTIIVELANTGEKDERSRLSVCQYFQELQLLKGISFMKAIPHPSEQSSLLYRFTLDPAHQLGAQILTAIFKTLTSNALDMGTRKSVEKTLPPDDDELFRIVDSLASDCYCPKGHFCLSVASNGSDAEHCCKCEAEFVDKSHYLKCALCPYKICHRCNDNSEVAATKSSRLLYLRRFFLICARQLQMFYSAFGLFWDLGGENQTLAFYYALLILRSARKLALPAMVHFDKENPLCDDQRCDGMQKFEDWRNTPFFITSEDNFHVISTSEETPFAYIARTMQKHPRNKFFAGRITEIDRVFNSVTRRKLQSISLDLTETPYSFYQEDPPLQTLLQIIGCFTGPTQILFQGIAAAKKDIYPGTCSLKELVQKEDRVERAVCFLQENGVDVTLLTDCTTFLIASQNYLRRIFGDKDNPPYCLTADNILRLIAVQIRLNTRIPVCIMGETGCGKFFGYFFFIQFFFPKIFSSPTRKNGNFALLVSGMRSKISCDQCGRRVE